MSAWCRPKNEIQLHSLLILTAFLVPLLVFGNLSVATAWEVRSTERSIDLLSISYFRGENRIMKLLES